MSYLKTYNEKMMPNGVINSDSLGNYTKPESGIPKSDLSEEVQETLNSVEQKQETLVSGENIKTINNESVLGEGNIAITAQTYVIDNTPAADSNNLVKSGGVASEIVWDVTARNSNATFASLAALLSDANLATLIPTTIRRGGMQIRFVHSVDNNYVQFRYMKSDASTVATFTNVTNWQGVDSIPTSGSKNLVTSGGVESVLFHQTFSKDVAVKASGQTQIALREFDYGNKVAIRIVSNTAAFASAVTISAGMRKTDNSSIYKSISAAWTVFETTEALPFNRIYAYINGEITQAGTVTLELIFKDAFNANIFDTIPTENSKKAIESGGVYNALKTIEDTIEDVNEGTIEDIIYVDEKRAFGLYGKFVNGSLRNGEWLNVPYRIASEDKISYDKEITITPKTGFKFGIHTFINGEFDTDSGWIRSAYTIPANTVFKITIARVTEDTSKKCDISEMLRGVILTGISTIESDVANLQDTTSANIASIGVLTTKTDLIQEEIGIINLNFIQGGINGTTGTISGASTRVTSELTNRSFRIVCKSDVIIRYWHRYRINELNSDFLGGDINTKSFVVEVDETYPYFNFTCSKIDGTAEVTPEYIKENISILYDDDSTIASSIQELQDDMAYFVKDGNADYYGDIQNISISESKHKMTSTKILEHTPNTYNGTLLNQSMAIFGGYYFCFNDISSVSSQNPFCVIISMADNSVVYAVTERPVDIGSSHVNNACFTDKYYMPEDEFPLILISRGDYPNGTAKGNEMYIYRIQRNNNQFTFTHIKTIILGKSFFGVSCEYDESRGMIWGHLCQGGDWRWGNPGYRKFNGTGLYFKPYNDNTQYICLESNDVASVDATITVTFTGSSQIVLTANVTAGNKATFIIPYTTNVGGYANIGASQSAEAFSGQYTVYECDENGNNRVEIDYRCVIAGFIAPDLTTSDTITVTEITNPVKIDNVIFQGGCCHAGKIFLPVQDYSTVNGQPVTYTGHCCFVVDPFSGRVESQIPTDTLENEGCAIYNGALYISSHAGNATGDSVSFRIYKYEF